MQTFSRAEASKCWKLPLGFTKFSHKGGTVIVPHGPFEPEISIFHIMSHKDALNQGIIGKGDFDDKWIVMATNLDMGCTEPYRDFETKVEAMKYMEEQALDTSAGWLK